MKAIVSNTGPLITLEHLPGGFELLRKQYDSLIIPPAVLQEVALKYPAPEAFIDRYQIADFLQVESPKQLLTELPLHAGEVAAISLAYELQLPLLIEERSGRRIAHQKGLEVSGMAGQIVVAQKRGAISMKQAVSLIDQLLDAQRINTRLHQALLDLLSLEV